MKTHQGYTSGVNGARCSECDDWIEPGENAVLLQPTTIEENGHAGANATAIHGLICTRCYGDL